MRAFLLLAALLIGLASPVRAADDVTAAAQRVIRSQVEDLVGADRDRKVPELLENR